MIADAFVLKNFSPISNKVQLLHRQHGKIVCMYSRGHQAQRLTTGSIIFCDVVPSLKMYSFEYLEIIQSVVSTDLDRLQFIHEIMKICIKLIPENVGVPDIFDFLAKIYPKIDDLSIAGRKVVLLKLFLLCEILPSESKLYQVAMQDPFAEINDLALLDKYLQFGWHEIAMQKEKY